ncbi:MAG: hypothetical protein E7290_14605 [Lachnospiraceae bacterium]|nr:hypothetical protein [Lachnospiraceae bacterium]
MEKFRNILLPAFTIALLGALISFWILTMLVSGAPVKQGFPLICVVLYTVLSFVLDKVAYVKERVWMKPLILVGVAAVLLLLLILL